MKHHIVIAALVLVAAPMAVAAEEPDDASDWGRCQAYHASEEGNESSNGSAHDNPGFAGINENCEENTSPPYEDTPADDRAPDDPGTQAPDEPGSQAPDDPGSQAPDDPGGDNDDNQDDGRDRQPDDPGSQQPSLYLP